MSPKRLLPILFLLAAPVSGQWYNVENDEEAVSLPDAPEVPTEPTEDSVCYGDEGYDSSCMPGDGLGGEAAPAPADPAQARAAVRATLDRILGDPVGNASEMNTPLAKVCFNQSLASRKVNERPITPEDALWLARMVYGENDGEPSDGEAAAMLWSLVLRNYSAAGLNGLTLARLAMAYSQPINPIWRYPDGQGCRKARRRWEADKAKAEEEGKAFAKTWPVSACRPHRFPRRQRYAAVAWSDMGERNTGPVVELIAGTLQNTAPASHGWLANNEWNTKGGKRFEVLALGGNHFYGRTRNPDMQGWGVDAVTIVAPAQPCP